VILLFIKGQFIRVIGFVAIVLGLFSLVALAVPQMASLPPAEESINIADIKTPTDMATIGQKIFFSKGPVRALPLHRPERIGTLSGFEGHRGQALPRVYF
jgi:hypothetical protein